MVDWFPLVCRLSHCESSFDSISILRKRYHCKRSCLGATRRFRISIHNHGWVCLDHESAFVERIDHTGYSRAEVKNGSL